MVILFIILFVCLINMILLVKHMKDMKHHKESYFEVDRNSTRVGPYEGKSFCSGWGYRTKSHDKEVVDKDIFYGSK